VMLKARPFPSQSQVAGIFVQLKLGNCFPLSKVDTIRRKPITESPCRDSVLSELRWLPMHRLVP
jgi:hypothetical protein